MAVQRATTFALLLIVSCVTPVWSQTAAPLRWETNLDNALKTAAATNRLVLVHFWAPWCKPCQRLESTVFNKPNLGPQLEKNYVPVKIDLDQNHALAQKYGVTAIPTDVIVNAQGQIVSKTHSPQTVDAYISTMQQIAAKYTASAAQVATKPASPVPSVNNSQPQPQAPPVVPMTQPAVPAPTTQPMPPATAPMGTKMAQNDAGEDRYAYYFNRGNPPATQPMAPPANEVAQTTAPTNPSYAAQVPVQPQAQPPIPSQPLASTMPPQTAPPQAAPPQTPAAQPPVAQVSASTGPITQAQLPPGSPPLALDGFCPVSLTERRQWVVGDPRFGAIHRGRTFLFVSQADQQKFLAQPDRFSPVMSGNDPVLALNGGQSVPGRREHGVFYNDRVFLFSSEDSLNEFARNPTRYSAEITSAMKQ